MALTFADAAPSLADLIEGGIQASDPRVMLLCNEATQALAAEGVWVGSMGEALICTQALDKTFTLPRELETAVEVTQIIDYGAGTPPANITDISNGWYEITNPSTFLDSDFWLDNVLVDRGEFATFADPCDGAYLRAYTLVPEAVGKKFLVQGFNGPNPVFTNPGSGYIEGEQITLPDAVPGASTGSAGFTKINRMRKDKTSGYVRVYAVPVDGVTPQYQIAFMHPDETEARYRRYYFPDMYIDAVLQPIAQLRVTGVRRFIPVTKPTDLLLIPNLQALKLMVKSILKSRNNQPQDAEVYKQQAIASLTAEVKRYQLDPKQTMIRKAQYLEDLRTLNPMSHAYVRAKIALEIPVGLKLGKSMLSRLINEAERNIIECGKWKGTLQVVTVPTQTVGTYIPPVTVESILDAAWNDHKMPVRGQDFQFSDNGPGLFDVTTNYGEEAMYDKGIDPTTGLRSYQIVGRSTDPFTLKYRYKVRFVEKDPVTNTLMQVHNFSALKAEVRSIIYGGGAPPVAADMAEAGYWHAQCMVHLDNELGEYMSEMPRPRVQMPGFAMSNVKAMR